MFQESDVFMLMTCGRLQGGGCGQRGGYQKPDFSCGLFLHNASKKFGIIVIKKILR